MADVVNGRHIDPGPNSLLIQLVDPRHFFPVPKFHFAQCHRFSFLDLDERGIVEDFVRNEAEEFTQEQADLIAELLKAALRESTNIIVHCHAGKCRSGAVAEVGVMMGFDDTGAHRIPNVLVKKKIMRALGWTYDSPMEVEWVAPSSRNGMTR